MVDANDMVEVEVWVIVDEFGEYGVGADSEAASEAYIEVGSAAHAQRQVKVSIRLPRPREVSVSVELPAESSEASVTVK